MSEVIDQKIVGYKVVTEEKLPALLEQKTLEREEVLTGATYKVKVEDWTYYITVNNIEVSGIARPYEVFISTKNAERYASLTTLTRLISAFFRTGHSYEFIATELQQIIDPKGGFWLKGKYYDSFESLLGSMLEKHFENLKQR